jgi:large subunit ribosomal protein L21
MVDCGLRIDDEHIPSFDKKLLAVKGFATLKRSQGGHTMYAILELGGRQWRVAEGTRFEVNRLPAEVGSEEAFDHVLAAHDGARLQVGRPYVPGASVRCEVVEHRKGPKVISYHFRRRENWRKTVGHRQPLTRLLVKQITLTSCVSSEQ